MPNNFFVQVMTSLNSVVAHCTQASVYVAEHVDGLAIVDHRIAIFNDSLKRLSVNCEALQQLSSVPEIITAAGTVGGFDEQIWSQLVITLKDCETILVAVNRIFGEISRRSRGSSRLRLFSISPIKQVQEQLRDGELARHHEKVKMFSISLALPMQLFNISLQLNQRDLSQEYQYRVSDRLVRMQDPSAALHAEITRMRHSRSVETPFPSGLVTPIAVEEEEDDTAVGRQAEVATISVDRHLSDTSSVASTPSISNVDDVDDRLEAHINGWREFLEYSLVTTRNDTARINVPASVRDDGSGSEEDDFELQLMITYFDNGQSDLAHNDFAGAEENFLEALDILQVNDFGDRLAFQSEDIIIMLAHCHFEQGKYDEAVELLLPLIKSDGDNEAMAAEAGGSLSNSTQQSSSKVEDRGFDSAVHYMLGKVYLKKQDYNNAEQYATRAFDGYLRAFDMNHVKFIESAQLLADVHLASGQKAKAQAITVMYLGSMRDGSSLPPRPTLEYPPPMSGRRLSLEDAISEEPSHSFEHTISEIPLSRPRTMDDTGSAVLSSGASRSSTAGVSFVSFRTSSTEVSFVSLGVNSTRRTVYIPQSRVY